ncbi:BspA family leucine-rich repeat surface protein [Xylocopilactobacillus apis]|uniref:Surface protein n=1 Tax=Xylocopilactobacillus apis TaxID=2932183 RepID=A0AAU9CT19_9LACO|nr:BspA family leucine-rich repeat surface protein [Xylocopilactobacillus apis]BDR57157.1 hypothetical protein KIMC2_17190 [Xylocopilactobacillus apis]
MVAFSGGGRLANNLIPVSNTFNSTNNFLNLNRDGNLTPITIGAGDSQNFFAPVQGAEVTVNENGTWDNILLNKPHTYYVGAVTLNATVDMTKNFNFSWDVKIDPVSDSRMADGIGFVFHPLYKPGERIVGSQGEAPYTLPAVFGRENGDDPVTSPTSRYNGQTIRSIGRTGGSLGIGDMMNAWGFKLDTYYNNYGDPESPGHAYGDNIHHSQWYHVVDDAYPSPNGVEGQVTSDNSFGSFSMTSNNGFVKRAPLSAPLNGSAVTSKTTSEGSVSGTAMKVGDHQWRNMTISYDASTYTMTVILHDATGSGQVTWKKTLTAGEKSVIQDRSNWGFAILASTGAYYEGHSVKNINGTFTPGDPVITTRYIDENGTDLQTPVTTTYEDWQKMHPGDPNFVDTNTQPTIVGKDGNTYVRAQVNGTIFANNTRINKRLGTVSSGTTVTANGNNLVSTTQFNNVMFLNYVYRRNMTASNTDIQTDIKFKINNGPAVTSGNVNNGDRVTFIYNVKNNNVPGIWNKVTAVQPLGGGLFETPAPLPTGVSVDSGYMYVPLNNGASNDLIPGATGTNTVTLKYTGGENAHITANDAGSIAVTTVPETASSPTISKIQMKVSIYDQSNQLIDEAGNPVWGSYFYDARNDKSPLAGLDPTYKTSNYVPSSDILNLDGSPWWTYKNGVLTLYPHTLNAYNDAVVTPTNIPNFPDVDWPWKQYSADITKVVINPGVTSSGSVSHLFNGLSAVTEFVGLNNLDLTNATDLNSLFAGCSSIESLDLSTFNTPNVTIMYRLVQKCTNLKRVTFGPNFITSNVDDFSGMFEGDKSLTDLDVSHFDTSKAENTYAMFSMCESLEAIDVSHFDMSHVTNANWMFLNCFKLKELNTSGFITTSLTNMQSMFSGCPLITHLDLSKFDVSNVTDMSYLFENSSGLTELDLSSFNIKPTANTLNMFNLAPPSVTEPNRTSALWKLTLGSGTKLGSQTLLPNPKPGTAINDIANPVPPNPQYYATNAQWREALTPTTVHAPTGAAKTAAQIATDSLTNTSAHTYVWDQVGSQTLEATPGSIDFGTHSGYLRNREYNSSGQNLKVTDNRNDRAGRRWRIEASVTNPFKLSSDPTKVIRGDPLYYHDTTTGTVTHLLPTAQTLYSEVATSLYQDVKNYPWTLSFKASPSDIPKAGRYNATVTFTLVNDTP